MFFQVFHTSVVFYFVCFFLDLPGIYVLEVFRDSDRNKY